MLFSVIYCSWLVKANWLFFVSQLGRANYIAEISAQSSGRGECSFIKFVPKNAKLHSPSSFAFLIPGAH